MKKKIYFYTNQHGQPVRAVYEDLPGIVKARVDWLKWKRKQKLNRVRREREARAVQLRKDKP